MKEEGREGEETRGRERERGKRDRLQITRNHKGTLIKIRSMPNLTSVRNDSLLHITKHLAVTFKLNYAILLIRVADFLNASLLSFAVQEQS